MSAWPEGLSPRPQRRRRVVVYVKEGANGSSSFYRLLQYVDSLRVSLAADVRVRVLVPEWIRRQRYDAVASYRGLRSLLARVAYVSACVVSGTIWMVADVLKEPDVLVIGRSLYPHLPRVTGSLYRRLLRRCPRVIWDFDDDIRSSGELCCREGQLLEAAADSIVLTHGGLRAMLPAECANRVVELPTTDLAFAQRDWRALVAGRLHSLPAEVRLVWVGSASGLEDLRSICADLDEFAEQIQSQGGSKAVLRVVSNSPLRSNLHSLRVENVPWSRESAIAALEWAQVGLMPLLDTQFARGKGGFKLVQYASAALPAVASDVGFNREVVEQGVTGLLVGPQDSGGWATSLAELVASDGAYRRFADASRHRWESRFSAKSALDAWEGLISEGRQ